VGLDFHPFGRTEPGLPARGFGHRTRVADDPEATVLTDMTALLGETSPAPVVADRYLLHRVLGQGGAAVVHEATDLRLERRVAVKVLRDPSRDEAERHRFVAEARLLGGLSHPHLVRVLDAGVDRRVPYLVLELVPGRTLAELMGDPGGRTIPPVRLAQLGAQVAQALAHVHAAGIVHRDVKPGNVLVTNDGEAKLADFGIARLVDDPSHCTRTGHLVGTVAYVAPEQVAGERATPAVDIYAWGLVLLEALTGARAYAGTSVESALARLSRPPDIPASLPPGWRSLLVAMTARDPQRRPTADQVADRLRALASPPPPRSGSSPSSRVVLVALAAAFAVLVAVAAWPWSPRPPGAPAAASATRSPVTAGTTPAAPATTEPAAVGTPVAAQPAAQDSTATPDRAGGHHRVQHHPRAIRHHHHRPQHHGHRKHHHHDGKHGHRR
jgi:serine/threonine protein kinase